MAYKISDIKKLEYEIFKYSSFSNSYLPENILEDSPCNQSSRWSSNNNNPPQFLILKLKRPAILKEIKFGKFEKSHVCNLKKFKIFGGLDEDHMLLILESGLVNDSRTEVFDVRHTTDNGDLFPVIYVKIMPLLSWGPSFNFSIWYVELCGEDDPMYVQSSLKKYNMLREIEIVKLCLKHFRQQGYDAAFKALQEQTCINLEHPLISQLHKCLVIEGNYKKTEDFVNSYIYDGLMDDFLNKNDYKHSWTKQKTKSKDLPGTRGGHQLIMDTSSSKIYLYGGWDGYGDLSDMWSFDVSECVWTLIFERSETHEGPSPRSCHKMVFDSVSGNIFMLGRYLDISSRIGNNIKSDFYLYDTVRMKWLQICDDTSQVGGPQLIYDHQMCIDVNQRMIYVFGGKILTTKNPTELEYSGLFSYHIATNTWTQILVDCHHPSASNPNIASIRSRVTHCMVFHNRKRKLYIYGGQRGKDDIDEFISYNVDTQVIEILNCDNKNSQGDKFEPLPGYTQRATIDCDKDEIYVFSSLSKQKERRELNPTQSSNSFWVYSIQYKKWSLIYTYKYANEQYLEQTKALSIEPCPRFAHQLIYDDVNKVHYLFGGNPGSAVSPQLRLDDFWLLLIEKPTRPEMLRQCKFLIRKMQFEEIAKSNPLKALKYLQSSVYEVINHEDPVELNNFHKLASLLFTSEENQLSENNLSNVPITQLTQNSVKTTRSEYNEENIDAPLQEITSSSAVNSYKLYKQVGGKKCFNDYIIGIKERRTFLFNTLVKLMPQSMVQPKGNLSDFVLI